MSRAIAPQARAKAADMAAARPAGASFGGANPSL
jgi:hypothetical protein